MALGEHLKELRRRFLISVLAVLACAVVGWLVYDPFVGFLQDPVLRVAENHPDRLVGSSFSSITDPFTVKLRLALMIGVVISAPIWLWQAWGFVTPGLTPRERRVAIGYFAAAVPLFIAGVALATFVFPRAVAVLLSFTPETVLNVLDMRLYLTFVTYLALGFGIAFLLPVVMVGLNSLRIFPARAMIKGWRIALVLILVFAASVTADASAYSMFVLAIPMFGLYWAAAGISTVNERRRRRKDEELLASWDRDAAASGES